MAAAGYRLRQSNYRQRREHAEATGQPACKVNTAKARTCSTSWLRLESASRQKDGGHDATLLAHVKGQLAEAIHARKRSTSNAAPCAASSPTPTETPSLRQQLSELEALRPERDQFDQERRLLKVQLDRHKNLRLRARGARRRSKRLRRLRARGSSRRAVSNSPRL